MSSNLKISARETSRLDDSIVLLKGIGEKTAADAEKLAIFSVKDLLDYFPFRYEDRTIIEPRELIDGQKVTVQGAIIRKPQLERRGRKTRVIAELDLDGFNRMQAVWFNQPYLVNQFIPGRVLSITGKYTSRFRQITVSQHEFIAPDKQAIHTGRIVPVYIGTSRIKTEELRKWITQVLDTYAEWIIDVVPEEIRVKYKLINKYTAYRWIHFPESQEQLMQAKRSLVFEEFFLYQLKLQLFRKQYKTANKGITHTYDRQMLRTFVDRLEFSLTGAQKRVITEILHDMEMEQPTYRLLHGDVGSGKTIVAAIAVLASWTCGYQSTLMVPTEILAEQHFDTISAYFKDTDIKICLLKGKLTKREREALLDDIKHHRFDLIIGTHALIQEDVEYAKLGLVIIDEQHRFGVEQRALLQRKGKYPDVLSMTATPIPRTMALTVFGDLDISVLDMMPSGRKKIKTEWHTLSKEQAVLNKMRELIGDDRQAYVVCPLIEESEALEASNAEEIYEQISAYFPDLQVDLLHGRLPAQEKDQIMERFAAGSTRILIATTVIEVGINVPNATVMLIYNADRFGLAQLHQLRGRVGRGEEQSYCFLLADAKGEIAKQRMQVMVESNDGFYIADKDLQLRGPGEFFGRRQSGLPEFKLGDIVNDYKIMEVARAEAGRYMENQALIHQGNPALLAYVKNNFTGSNFLA